MNAALRPTAARLALLRAVAGKEIMLDTLDRAFYNADNRKVTARAQEVIDAGYAEIEGTVGRHRRFCGVELTAAGRLVLDTHPEEQR